ncbi:MAG: lactoylglutathione lyase [Rhodocyclales bacterium]|nr:lactoylglutathione lyase [Rhodocyclales bacterium]
MHKIREIDLVGSAASGVEGRNMDHFCLRVEPFGATAISEHLRACGLDVGEFFPRYGAEGHGPSLYITDPEGNRVERKGPPTL